MKEMIIRCDECGCKEAISYKYVYDTVQDPSGNGYDDVYTYTDLCLSCLQNFVRKHPDVMLENI